MSEFDALLPPAIAAKAEAVGVAKAQQPFARLATLSVLAGAFIAFGADYSIVVTAGGGLAPGVARLLGGVVFSLGLVLVVVAGAELFTGDTLLVIAWASRRLRMAALLRTWAIVYVGNFVGALGVALLVLWSDQAGQSGGQIGVRALEIAERKSALGFVPALVLGILANVLVCLAVWLCFAARSVADKVVAVILPVSAFVAAGFEHSIANMFFLPLGVLLRHDTTWSPTPVDAQTVEHVTVRNLVVGNLIPVTLGNIIGGAVFVGLVYWFVYLRGTTERT
jgi:formate/nitrite transporter